jgi:UDP:flavonoid glycosyltransferase YjiC (YdhE family)
VPMVLTPWDRDQFAVAYRAQKIGTARVIARDSLTAARLHDELSSAMGDVNLRNAARKHSERIQTTNPRKCAVELLLTHV